MSMDTDRLSGVKYQSHAEPNIYFQNCFTTNHSSQNTSAAAQLDSENETSEEYSVIQRSNTVKVTNEKQLMKIKVLVIVAVSVMSVFLALAIGLALFATMHSQKQLSLPDIAMEVTKHVTPLQGNLTVLKNQLIDVYTKQVNEHAKKIKQLNKINGQQTQTLNEYAQQIQQLIEINGQQTETLNEYAQQFQQLNEINSQQTQTLNEYAQQIQTSNDITETISNDLAEYAQQTGIMEDNVNQYRAMVDQLRNNLSTVPSKSMHE